MRRLLNDSPSLMSCFVGSTLCSRFSHHPQIQDLGRRESWKRVKSGTKVCIITETERQVCDILVFQVNAS